MSEIQMPRKPLYNPFKNIYAHPYNQAHPAQALLRYLRWQLDKRLKKGPIVYQFWNNRRITCYPESFQTMWLIHHVVYDWDEFCFIGRFLKARSSAFDVGANIGIYTLWLSRFIGPLGRIVSFEPDESNYRKLLNQLSLNSLNRVVTERVALAETNGVMNFSVGKDGENSLVLKPVAGEATVDVTTRRLDDYCKVNTIDSIDFVKLDVEGAEHLVLKGASSLLSNKAIKVIQLESNKRSAFFGVSQDDVRSLLAQHGYQICIFDVRRNIMIPKSADTTRENVFALHDMDDVNNRLSQNNLSIEQLLLMRAPSE